MLLDLLRESVIVQAILVISILGLIGGLLFTGREVPELLWQLLLVVVGYYFGAGTGMATYRISKLLKQ